MPIYEYQCVKCAEIFEAFQKINDKPLEKCKYCGGKAERLISQSSFQLKGSGWYLTDYSRKPAASAESGGKSDSKSSESSGPKTASKDKDLS